MKTTSKLLAILAAVVALADPPRKAPKGFGWEDTNPEWVGVTNYILYRATVITTNGPVWEKFIDVPKGTNAVLVGSNVWTVTWLPEKFPTGLAAMWAVAAQAGETNTSPLSESLTLFANPKGFTIILP